MKGNITRIYSSFWIFIADLCRARCIGYHVKFWFWYIIFETFFNTLTANCEVTRTLHFFPGCQTASYLVLTHIKKSTCRFLSNFLKIAAAVNVLQDFFLWDQHIWNCHFTVERNSVWQKSSYRWRAHAVHCWIECGHWTNVELFSRILSRPMYWYVTRETRGGPAFCWAALRFKIALLFKIVYIIYIVMKMETT